MDGVPTQAAVGPAQVATAAFVASRAVPAGGFVVALAAGVALARVAQRRGARAGWGASIAATLQAIAIMGPSRVGVPLTQALSAPLLGRMEACGRGALAQGLVVGGVRLLHNVATAAFAIWVVLGLEAYAGGYDAVLGRVLPFLPPGTDGALLATAIGLLLWTLVASVVQTVVYRRGLHRWPSGEPRAHPVSDPGAGHAAHAPRFDPRAVVLAALVAFAVLLASLSWIVLGAVAAWLAVSAVLARGDASVVRPGLVLVAALALGTLVAGLVGGLGIELSLQRAARAGLLVLVAVWMRSAAGEEGLREVFRRALHRLRGLPGARETAALLGALGTTRDLADAGRRLVARLEDVPRAPVALTDAVLDWVVAEAGRPVPGARPVARPLRARGRDGALVALVALVGLALPVAG